MTDARYRFERGVDPQSVLPGLESGDADDSQDLRWQAIEGDSRRRSARGAPHITFDTGQVAKLAGLELPESEIRTILESLGCEILGKGDVISVTTPSWRPDLHGAGRFSSKKSCVLRALIACPQRRCRVLPALRVVLTERQKRSRRARRTLAARGLVEAITWSFIPAGRGEGVRRRGTRTGACQSDLASNWSSMRPGLLPGLLTALKRNGNRGSPMRRCSNSARPIAARRRKISSSQRPACAAARRRSVAAGGIGTARRRRSSCSMPKPTSTRCWRRLVSIPARRRSRAMRPPGIIRAGLERCGSAPRRCLPTSGSCIPQR